MNIIRENPDKIKPSAAPFGNLLTRQ